MFSDTIKIFSALGEDNVRFVGGCVRDLIAGKRVKDIDFATTITPQNIVKLLDKAGIRYFTTGIEHGSVTAVINNKTYDITTLRRDINTNGRHAQIEYIDDWEQDAARRDFTFNAFYLDSKGKLYDYFGGMDHLRGGKVVFIGDADTRIKEDYLRMLRYYRFMGIFGKDAPETFIAKVFQANAAGLEKLSGERIQAEMKKILETPIAPFLLEYMADHGVLPYVLPGQINLEFLRKLIAVEAECKMAEPDFIRRLAVISGYDVLKICERWKLSGAQQKIIKLVSGQQDFSDPKVALRRLGPERFVDSVLITAARGELNYRVNEMVQFAYTWQIPKFPVYGRDALQFGIKEGKLIGQILMDLESHWEKNSYAFSRDQLLAMLKEQVAKHLPKEEPKPAEPEPAPQKPAIAPPPVAPITPTITKPASSEPIVVSAKPTTNQNFVRKTDSPVIFGRKKKDDK